MEAGYLHGGEEPGHDERSGDDVLRVCGKELCAIAADNVDGGGDDAGEHG